MQTDPPDQALPASSPPVPSFRTAPTPARAGLARRDTAASPTRSRLRATQATTEHDMLNLHVQTPYSELGNTTPHTWRVSPSLTIRQVKDDIASGAAGYGRWERDGLRIVWRGRVLGDEDELRAVFGPGETHSTVHLVARLIAPAVTVPVAAPAASHRLPTPAPPATPMAVALADCVHYLLFTSRGHLCYLLGSPALQWDDMHPKPTLSHDSARVAVMSVVRACLPHLEWEGAFDHVPEVVWSRLGRIGATNEVQALWLSTVGRQFSHNGESTPVELDRKTYQLVLPPLSDMVPTQLVHLLLYLRISTLLPSLYACLSSAKPAQAPTPTPTTPAVTAAPNPNAAIPQGVQVHRISPFSLPRIPFAWAQHLLFSAIRLGTMAYMLVGSLPVEDLRLWLILGAASAYWAIDGAVQRQRIIESEDQERMARERAEAPAEPQAAPPAAEDNPLDPALMAAEQPPVGNPRVPLPANRNDWLRDLLKALPMWNLDHDAAYLRLPQNSRPPLEPTPILNTRPNFIMCRIVLPVYLWILTLVPAFEMRRARAIRQRERNMRSLVNGLTERARQEQEGEEAEEPQPVLPDGLLSQVKAYYLRVVSREEAIDWEEEREAQRAMGIRDEDEPVPML